MPMYVLNNRNYTYSNMGFTIPFKKGEPIFVPPMLERDVVSLGAECVDGPGADALPPEDTLPEVPVGDSRKQALVDAMKQLADRNDPKDFTGQGIPRVKSVEKLISFEVDQAELVEVWREMREAAASQE